MMLQNIWLLDVGLGPNYRLAATYGVCQQRLVLFKVNDSMCVNCIVIMSYKLYASTVTSFQGVPV